MWSTFFVLCEVFINQASEEVKVMFALSPHIVQVFTGVVLSHKVNKEENWLQASVILDLLGDAVDGITEILSYLCTLVGEDPVGNELLDILNCKVLCSPGSLELVELVNEVVVLDQSCHPETQRILNYQGLVHLHFFLLQDKAYNL
jgi:hypothetical protein